MTENYWDKNGDKAKAAFIWWESPLINCATQQIYITARLQPRVVRTRDETLYDFVLRAFNTHLEYYSNRGEI